MRRLLGLHDLLCQSNGRGRRPDADIACRDLCIGFARLIAVKNSHDCNHAVGQPSTYLTVTRRVMVAAMYQLPYAMAAGRPYAKPPAIALPGLAE